VEVFLRDRDSHGEIDGEVLQRFTRFATDSSRARPGGDDAEFAAQLLISTLEAVGKSLATRKLTGLERERWAINIATMLCNHLEIGEPSGAHGTHVDASGDGSRLADQPESVSCVSELPITSAGL